MRLQTQNIYDMVRETARKRADKIALVFGSKALTYDSLIDEIDQTAAVLRSLGVGRRDRVAIHLRKSIDEVVMTFAIASVGAVVVNINYQLMPSQIEQICLDCRARFLFSDRRKIRRLEAEVAALGDSTTILEVPADPAPKTSEPTRVSYSPITADLAALLYTSGSTGSPKGVMINQGHLLNGARIVSDYLGLSDSDVILSVPPLSFDYGLNQVLDAFLVGATLVLSTVNIPAEIAKTVRKNKISVLPMVAPGWAQFLRHLSESGDRITDLRIATNTGGRIPQHSLELVPDLLPDTDFFLMYGLTEAFRSTYLPPAMFQEKMGAIGFAIPDNEIFVVDPDSGLCEPGKIGELVHRGSTISGGYWNQPELTEDKIKPNPHLSHLIGDEPVVHSGDLVRMDIDGVLWFEGRIDDLIKCSGYRISSSEVEELAASLDSIVEVVAFGVPDSELGQVVEIGVSCPDKPVQEEDVIARCRQIMPSYMVPRRVHLLEGDLPRNSNGKFDRQRIYKMIYGAKDA